MSSKNIVSSKCLEVKENCVTQYFIFCVTFKSTFFTKATIIYGTRVFPHYAGTQTIIEYCHINMFCLSKWSVNCLDLEPKSLPSVTGRSQVRATPLHICVGKAWGLKTTLPHTPHSAGSLRHWVRPFFT